jgi:hypothetical protein
MAVAVKKVVLWRKEIDNRPGMLANTLEALSQAGTDLQVVMAYRYPGGKDTAAIELHPVSGRRVAQPWQRKFLGFSFTGHNTPHPARRIAPQALERFRQRVREMTWRRRGVSIEQTVEELGVYFTGWRGYFGLCETPWQLRDLDSWVRRRLRAVIWKQWKTASSALSRIDAPRGSPLGGPVGRGEFAWFVAA